MQKEKINPDLDGFSTPLLNRLHETIRIELNREDGLFPAQWYLGVREFTDWRVLSNSIETILYTRGVDFDPIYW